MWKNNVQIQNNYPAAKAQLSSLQRQLSKDHQLSVLYDATLPTDIEKGYVKPVVFENPQPERIWYLPHHPVFNPNKPGKVRRVANAASIFKGQSLNTNLVSGPDLINILIGILLHFREKPIAVLADIEAMFMQIALISEDQSCLRFLWPTDQTIRQYQYTRLIFSARCSPATAIFVLQRTAQDFASRQEIIDLVNKSFYMDDFVHSFQSTGEAQLCVSDLKSTLQKSGFNLTKFVTNEPNALKMLQSEHIESETEGYRVLGLRWNSLSDTIFQKKMVENRSRRFPVHFAQTVVLNRLLV